MTFHVPRFECYIVAQHEGRRVLIPVEAAELTIRTDDPDPLPLWAAPFVPRNRTNRVELRGTVPKYFIWEDGANPEDLRTEQVEPPQPAIEE